jgi:hypothetical protein
VLRHQKTKIDLHLTTPQQKAGLLYWPAPSEPKTKKNSKLWPPAIDRDQKKKTTLIL